MSKLKKLLLTTLLTVGVLGAQQIPTTYWNGLRWDTGPTAPTNCYEPGVYYQTSGTVQFMLCDVKARGFVAIPLSTSGTFVTPNLGTPTAINLANATNLPSSAAPVVKAVDASITATSLATEAVCALHTDTPDGVHACNNPVTDATAANCVAGTLTVACTFPISLTISANVLGSNVAVLNLDLGVLATATIPTSIFEIYLDSTRVYAGVATTAGAGVKPYSVTCLLSTMTATSSAPLAMTCATPNLIQFGPNNLLSNTTPAIAIDTTVSHVLKVSCAFTAATTGNSAWLYGMRLSY